MVDSDRPRHATMRPSLLCALGLTALAASLFAPAGSTARATPARSQAAQEGDAAPVWSPNGKEIAFVDQGSSGAFEVNVIGSSGGGRRQLTSGRLSYNDVAWSPSGTQLGFSGLTNGQVVTNGHVYLERASGGTTTALTSGSGFYDELFGWSPDGTMLSFDRITDGVGAIFTMAANGTDLHELTPSAGDDDYWAVWSPDGKQIAFDRTGNGPAAGGDIWVMNADGSDQRELTDNPDDNFGSAWSPDGKQIAFHVEPLRTLRDLRHELDRRRRRDG